MSKQEIKGLGDAIEVITVALGIKKIMPKDCGCKKRRERWNEKISFKRDDKTK